MGSNSPTRDAEEAVRVSGAGSSSPQSRAQEVYSAIREDILTAAIKPGQLVLEAELAKQHGVSKTPVREALQTLAAEDLVTAIPRRGYLVTSMGFNDVREMMELRLIIEPAMAAAAAKHATPETVEQLESLFARHLDATTVSEQTASARGFHQTIALAARNERARRTLEGLWDTTTRVYFLMPSIERHLSSEAEFTAHRAILEAIAAADEKAARIAMHDHLNASNRDVLAAFLGE